MRIEQLDDDEQQQQQQQVQETSPTCTHAQTNERVVGRLRTKGEVHSG